MIEPNEIVNFHAIAHTRKLAGIALEAIGAIVDEDEEGASYPQVFSFDTTPEITIGRRSSTMDSEVVDLSCVRWRSQVMSRQHAKLVYHAGTSTVRIFDLNSHHGTFIVKVGQTVPYRIPPGTMFTLDDGDTLTFGKTVGREILVHPISVRIHLEYSNDSPLQSEPSRPFRFGFTSEGDGASEMSISDDDESSENPSSELLDEHLDNAAPESPPVAPNNSRVSQVTNGSSQSLPPIQGLLRSLSKCIPFSSIGALRLPHIKDQSSRFAIPTVSHTSPTTQVSSSVNIAHPSPPLLAPTSPAPVRYHRHSTESHTSQSMHNGLRMTQSVTTFDLNSPLPSPRPSPERSLGSIRLRGEDWLAYHQQSESDTSSIAEVDVDAQAHATVDAAIDTAPTTSQVDLQLQNVQLETITDTLSRIEAQLVPLLESSTRLKNTVTENSENDEERLCLFQNVQAEEQRRRQEFKEIMENARAAVAECRRYSQETSLKRAREQVEDNSADSDEHRSRRRRTSNITSWITSTALSASIVALSAYLTLAYTG